MSAFGPKQTCSFAPHMSAFGGKADIRTPFADRLFSNAGFRNRLRIDQRRFLLDHALAEKSLKQHNHAEGKHRHDRDRDPRAHV
jgi:hypothetical protein